MKKYLLIVLYFICQFSVVAQWNTDRILTIGQNALYFKDYVLSIQYFNQVIKIKPYLAEPYIYRAIAKIELGDYQGADQDCSEAIERNPFLPQAYYARGFARRKMNYFTEAVQDFSKALEFSPNNLNLLLNRMDVLQRKKDYIGALSDLETYMKLNPKNTTMMYEKGMLQLMLQDTVRAQATFDTFISIDSTSSFGWSARGLLRMQQNDLNGALSDYTQAINRKTTYVGDYINRGIINVQKKNYNQALNDYDNGIKLDNKNALAYYNRALLRANLGDNNNALQDLNKVIELDTNNMEALLRKAMLQTTLKNYKNAIADYKKIVKKYEYFIPAYLGIAEAESGLGNQKAAFQYRQIADNIEKNKEYILRKSKDDIKTENKIVDGNQLTTTSKQTELFNRFANQNVEESNTETSKYDDNTRGAVQDNYTDIVNERLFILSYYAKNDEIRRTNVYYPTLEQYNKQKKISSILKLTNNEIPLTSELISSHFEAINDISSKIINDPTNADIYFNRALEFALVQDFNSAIEDLNKAINLRPKFMLAYFSRAIFRYKLVDYLKNSFESKDKLLNLKEGFKKPELENQSKFDVDLIMYDYDKVIQLNPDFSFAYFNKANILCTQKDFRTAILNFTKAIEVDPDFAEAYFNRGLTYLFIGDNAKGLADLSKSGELGIYKVYNLIQRFKNN